MKAVILCGGQGTRIRDVSEVLPKPMLPIGGKPILWHIMKIYSSFGINEFILCLGYKGWVIKEFFLNYKAMLSDFTINLGQKNEITYHNEPHEFDWVITFAETGEKTQTGSRIKKIRKYLGEDESFFLTYGDGLSNCNIDELLKVHNKSGKTATLTGVHPLGRFGEIEFNNGVVTEFKEKPNVSQGRINGGFMILSNKKIWKYFENGDGIILEREPLMNMVKDCELSVYEHNGFWQCMDTLREYNMLNKLWSNGEAPWKIW